MFDAYTRQARLAPALLAGAPALVLALCGAVRLDQNNSMLMAVLGVVGLVVCGVVRERGRTVQVALWQRWGGPPTTRLLRWRDAADSQTHARLLARVEKGTGVPMPSPEAEAADPQAADRAYERAVADLRARTRDLDRFSLLGKENAEYGFRRNCLGLRPVGLGVACVVLALSVVMVVLGAHQQRFVVSAAVAALVGFVWLRVVSGRWVRAAADRYAERLLETSALLQDG